MQMVCNNFDIFSEAIPSIATTTIVIMAEGCKLFVYGVGENISREELEDEFGRFEK